MAYRNTFFRWLFLYSLTFGLTYVLKLFTYLCPETGHRKVDAPMPSGEAYADFGNRPLSLQFLTAKKPHLMEPSVFT